MSSANPAVTSNHIPALSVESNANDNTTVVLWADPTTHRILVDASFSPSGTQDVNLTKVGGVAIALGQTTMAASIPVTLASNQSALAVTLTSTTITGTVTVAGNLTNNGAAPAATNVGALVALANAAAPSYTEGRQVLLSTDLAGALRVTGSLSVGGTTDNSAFTAGTSTGTPAMGFYHATVDTVTDGRAAAVAITSKRAQHSSLFTPLGDSAMDDTLDSVKVTNATAANLTAMVSGVVAKDAPVSGNPVYIAGFASAAAPTDVSADGDAVPPWLLRSGAQAVQGTFAGVLASTGAGANGTGVQRVTLATDQTAISTAGVFSVKIDQTTVGTTNAISLAQIGANAVSAGNGASGTGVQRVTIANDSTGVLASIGSITTSVVPGTGATNLGKAEDAGHTTGDTGVAVWAVRNDTAAALAGTTLDYIPFTTDALGKLWTADNQVEDAAHASGDRGSFSLAVGNEAQSTLAADGDYIGHAVDTKGNNLTVGNLAADAVDAGFPVKVGGQARTTNPTAVADADRSNFITDKLGKQVVVGSIRDLKAQQITTITSSTSETTVVTAVASTFMDVYGCIVVNSSATAANVSFKDSTAGTTRFNIYVPAGETRGFMLNESAAINQGTVNNNWTATSSASVASLIITMLTVKNT